MRMGGATADKIPIPFREQSIGEVGKDLLIGVPLYSINYLQPKLVTLVIMEDCGYSFGEVFPPL